MTFGRLDSAGSSVAKRAKDEMEKFIQKWVQVDFEMEPKIKERNEWEKAATTTTISMQYVKPLYAYEHLYEWRMFNV